ncbi:hypothetical protein WNX13_05765 [Lactobacillus delbrueckii]|uniref:hypothetical protein n=1 Tax=Lactobacillus delbrueckii TaxID=1584 RepID=UPI0030E7DF26
MLDFKKIADILAPPPGKTALLIKDKTGVLYASPLAGEEFKSASLIKLLLLPGPPAGLKPDGPCPGRQDR